MYTGKCLCGAVEVAIQGAITAIIHCHCSLCRKNSGTAYATNGFVNSTEFIIEKGQEALSEFSFKAGRTRYFCQYCGSPVYSANDSDKNRIRLRLGIIDSAISERPMSHNFINSKANWEDLTADLPHYSSFEPDRLK